MIGKAAPAKKTFGVIRKPIMAKTGKVVVQVDLDSDEDDFNSRGF
jgi:hypothetical protein